MVRVVKRCLRLFMKLVNSICGITGIAMILYSLWMIRVWQIDAQASSFDQQTSTMPCHGLYMHSLALVSLSVPLLALAMLLLILQMLIVSPVRNYHVMRDSLVGCVVLTEYMVIVLSILLLETLVFADMFLNSEWEKDFPDDPSGRFDDFKDFVKSNLDICQWVGFSIILAQGFSILSATVLRTLNAYKRTKYDSDYDYDPRLPLLNPHRQPLPYVVGEPHFAPKNEAWKVLE